MRTGGFSRFESESGAAAGVMAGDGCEDATGTFSDWHPVKNAARVRIERKENLRIGFEIFGQDTGRFIVRQSKNHHKTRLKSASRPRQLSTQNSAARGLTSGGRRQRLRRGPVLVVRRHQHMKQCTYCGKEYPDEASVCAIDAQPLRDVVPPLPAPSPSPVSEKQQIIDAEHIKLLAIFHFVVAGLALLGI